MKLIISLVILFSSNIASASWQLTFSDEFNEASLDPKWRTSYRWGDLTLPANKESQCYSKDGVLPEFFKQ
jgi:hypothetical protein